MANPIDLSGAPSLEAQAYEVALAMQQLEAAAPAENRPDNVQVAFDTEANTVAIGITLGTSLTVTNGNAVISPQTYLN